MVVSPRFASGAWGYDVNFSGTISGQKMTGSAFGVFDVGNPLPQYTCGACACSASFNGAFFGAGASHAGAAYQINAPSGQSVSGAVVFQK
jgi:hypothetical protein